jgi:hypothetical protein
MILGGGYFPFLFSVTFINLVHFKVLQEGPHAQIRFPTILKWPSSMLQLTLFIPFKFILFSLAWSPFSLPYDFFPLVNFYTPLNGIRVLGFPFGYFSFTSPFLQDILNNNVHHIKLLSTLGDIQMIFGIFFIMFCPKVILFSLFVSSTFEFLALVGLF